MPVIYKDCVRDFVHVSDIALAVLDIVDNWRSGTFQLGTGIGTRIADLPRLLDVKWKRYKKTCNDKEIGYQAERVADKDRILPGWKPVPIEVDCQIANT